MGWLISVFSSSIGKKQIMASTGLFFCLFLATHLVGNLTIYGGKGMFNAYAEHLHAFGPIINVIELALLFFAVLHISFGALLYFQNWRARPVRYQVKKNAGGRTLTSTLMPYTGLYLLIYVILHLFTFHFADRSGRTLYQLVADVFSRPEYIVFYIFSMVVAALHVKHGFWSAFQTIGADHPKYMPLIQGVGWIFSLLVGVGFGSIPLIMLAGN
jgi:succinate dehydrogenase / fumarate reductase cytochrome b subunit